MLIDQERRIKDSKSKQDKMERQVMLMDRKLKKLEKDERMKKREREVDDRREEEMRKRAKI